MRGLSPALHSWQASWFHTRQGSCLNTPPAVSRSAPSFLQETTAALQSTTLATGGPRWRIPEDAPSRIKPQWNNTHWLGVKCPTGEPLQLTYQHSKSQRGLEMMYWCADTIFWIREKMFPGWSSDWEDKKEKVTDWKFVVYRWMQILGSTILKDEKMKDEKI